MTISEALKKYSNIEADLLLARVLKQSKEFLYLHPQKKLTSKDRAEFESLALKRQQGVPAAYLLGYKNFYGLSFKVNRNVLIPRPESEWLVDTALQILRKLQSRKLSRIVSVLDIGTGSGCLAISIGTQVDLSKVKVVASDVSEKALAVARQNIKKLLGKSGPAGISLVHSDMFNHISGKFDIIVANLPYVPVSEYLKRHQNLAYEPFLALTDGTDTFELIQEFLTAAKTHLARGGTILLETDPASIKILRKHIAKTFPSKRIKVVKDIHKLQRFIVIS